MKVAKLTWLWLCLALLVLQPYFIFGQLGVIVAVGFALYGVYCGVEAPFIRHFYPKLAFLLGVSAMGAIASVVNGIPQLNHAKAVLTVIVVVTAARGILWYCKRNRIEKGTLLLLILSVICANSGIVLAELASDRFRAIIEAGFEHADGGAIDYAYGYRLRGIASAGGAGLSLLVPVGMTLALYLYTRTAIGILALAGAMVLLVTSVLVIGRTGLVLAGVPIVAFTVSQVLAQREKRRSLSMFVFGVAVATLAVWFGYSVATERLGEKFGAAFSKYAYGFLLEGRAGIEEEGTISVLLEYIKVLPTEFPYCITGYGFYGGSDFLAWTDSGFARMFLAVGFPLGIAFYVVLLKIGWKAIMRCRSLMIPIAIILVIAEFKEPLLYVGFAARVFVILVVFYYHEDEDDSRSNGRPLRPALARHLHPMSRWYTRSDRGRRCWWKD